MPKEFYSNFCAQNWVVNHTSTHRAVSNESPGHSPPPGASSTFSRSLKPHSRPMTPLYDTARDANTRRHFLFSSVLLLTIANTSKSQPFLMPIDSLMVMCSPGLPFCWSSLFWWFAFSKTCLSSAEPARGHHKINLVFTCVDIGRCSYLQDICTAVWRLFSRLGLRSWCWSSALLFGHSRFSLCSHRYISGCTPSLRSPPRTQTQRRIWRWARPLWSPAQEPARSRTRLRDRDTLL